MAHRLEARLQGQFSFPAADPSEEDLTEIRARGNHYSVVSRQPERNAWQVEFKPDDD